MSSFNARNLYYLRISANNVLPLYLYLDERHVNWMSDKVLQHVLADLRPLIIPKLRAEADAHIGPGGPPNAKKGTVEVHRGDAYQFAFFFRKTEPHSVLIKTRNYVALPVPPAPPPLVPSDDGSKKLGKRTRTGTNVGRTERKKSKTKGQGKALANEYIDLINVDEDSESDQVPRRSQRPRKHITGGGYQAMEEDGSPDPQEPDEDFEMEDDDSPKPDLRKTPGDDDHDVVVIKDEEREPSIPKPPQPSTINLESQAEERKPKPVVEPWPPVRAATVPPSFARESSRAVSVAPLAASGTEAREQTPLFLPDNDERGRSATPAPGLQQNLRPPVPLFDDPPIEEEEDDDGELVLFSQILNATGESRMEADDDDEFDGAVLFGDADEIKELQ